MQMDFYVSNLSHYLLWINKIIVQTVPNACYGSVLMQVTNAIVHLARMQ